MENYPFQNAQPVDTQLACSGVITGFDLQIVTGVAFSSNNLQHKVRCAVRHGGGGLQGACDPARHVVTWAARGTGTLFAIAAVQCDAVQVAVEGRAMTAWNMTLGCRCATESQATGLPTRAWHACRGKARHKGTYGNNCQQ